MLSAPLLGMAPVTRSDNLPTSVTPGPSDPDGHAAASSSAAACEDGCCAAAPAGVSLVRPRDQLTEDRRRKLIHRVRLLVAATITYNIVEAVVAITAGVAASSTALIGFGLDSVIEVASAAAVAWQFTGSDPQSRERAALRIIALSFFVLAGYVTVESVRSLLGAVEANPSTTGIVLAALSLLVMPMLSRSQRRAGRELGSRSAVADSQQTMLCTYLSAVLLLGLLLNALFGWAWADPLAALVIAVLAVREGREAWRGHHCC